MSQFEYPVTALRICIDVWKAEENELEGRICGVALEDEVEFSGSSELLLRIDHILDQIGKPQASRKIRSFKEEEKKASGGYCSNPKRYHSSGEIAGQKGNHSTKDVYFKSRLRSTWQGFVRNDRGEILGSFESDLEFLNWLLV